MFHYCNYQLWENVEDYVAWRGLSGQISEEEFLKEKFIEFGKKDYKKFKEKIDQIPGLKNEYERKRKESWELNREKHLEKLKEVQKLAVEAARTPEAREKQKQKLKEIGHQQGEKNSQFGTMWIHNIQLKQSIRISKDHPIPEGWEKGRVIDFDLIDKKKRNSEEKKLATYKKQQEQREKTKQYFTDLYEIYKDTTFKEFCIITGYERTHQNLCTNFKKYVDNYDPKVYKIK